MRRFVPEGAKFATPDAQRRYGDIRRKASGRAREGRRGARGRRRSRRRPEGAQAGLEGARRGAAPAAPARGLLGRRASRRRAEARRRSPARREARRRSSAARRAARRRAHARRARRRSTSSAALVAEPADGKKLPGVDRRSARTTITSAWAAATRSRRTRTRRTSAPTTTPRARRRCSRSRASSPRRRSELRRDVVFVAFSGEESGVLGSAHFVHAVDAAKARRRRRRRQASAATGVYAMLNMDMVGRMRDNRLQVLGAETRDGVAGHRRGARATRRASTAPRAATATARATRSIVLLGRRAGAALLHRHARRLPQAVRHGGQDQRRRRRCRPGRSARRVALALVAARGAAHVQGGRRRAARRTATCEASTPRSARSPTTAARAPGKKGVLLAGVRPGGARREGRA